MLLVWCGVSFYYSYSGCNWAHRSIGYPFDVTDEEEDAGEDAREDAKEDAKEYLIKLFILGIHLLVFGVALILILSDTHAFDLGLDSLWCTLIFCFIYLMIFPTRYGFICCQYWSDPKKLARLVKGCDCMVMNGLGFMNCFYELLH